MKTAATSTIPGEICDCLHEMLMLESGNHPEVFSSGDVRCGCGDPDCTHSLWKREDIVHFEGKHWLLWCAFRELLGRLEGERK